MPLYGLLALALLMIVHESGHFFAARAFGMRVERFSIGFGPRLFSHQPKDSDTTYQVALIPFLAYVQIAGMNPFEEIDPEDRGSYANASLTGRTLAIFAGPAANYLFASVVFFGALLLGGKTVETTRIVPIPKGAAAAAGLRGGDRVVSINEVPVQTWEGLRTTVLQNPGKPLSFRIDRGGQPLTLSITPRPEGEKGGGLIGVRPQPVPMPVGEAASSSLVQPALIVGLTVRSLYRWIAGTEAGQLTGPLGIMRETEKAAGMGLVQYLMIVGFLSTSVGFFNMLPFPALDGGRLVFLLFEAVTRRQPNQKVEARVHMVGMLLLLTAIALVSIREWGGRAPSDEAKDSSPPRSRPRQQSPLSRE